MLRLLLLTYLTTVCLIAADYVDEGGLAAGWPVPGEPGVINLAALPAYRAAEGPGFWPLFQHINSGGIAMTTPVVRQANSDPKSPKGAMRFVYPTPQTPKGPEKNSVRVIDVASQQVLRIAWRGEATKEQRDSYRQQLEDFAQKNNLTPAGDAFVFGYNSPFVSSDKRTWELALPVTKK